MIQLTISVPELISAVNNKTIGKEGILLLDESMHILAYNKQVSTFNKIFTANQIGNTFHCFFENSIDYLDNIDCLSPILLQKSLENKILLEKSFIAFCQGQNKIKWGLINSESVTIENRTLTSITIYEVNSIYQQQRTLKDKIAHFETLVSSIDDIIFEVSRLGDVLNCWTAVPEQLFLPKEHMIGKSIIELFPREFAFQLIEIIQQTFIKQQEQQMEYQSPFDSQREEWFRLRTKLIFEECDRITVVISNITDEIKARSQAIIEEQKFNKIFSHSSIGMVLVNAQGEIIECNDQFVNILGYNSGKEIIGQKFIGLTHPSDQKASIRLLTDLKLKKREKAVMEKRYIHKNGSFIWCLLTVSTVHITDNQPSFYLGQIQDLSLFKENEHLLKIQQTELKRTNFNLKLRISQLEAFNQIIAHDLRTPASNIEMITQQLEEFEIGTDGNVFLSMLQQSNKRLFKIINDITSLLENQKFDEILLENCAIKTITKEILKSLGPLSPLQKSLRIIFDLKEKNISFPRKYMQSILHHIFSFSLKDTNCIKSLKIKIFSWKKENLTYLSFQFDKSGKHQKKRKGQFLNALQSMQSHTGNHKMDFFIAKHYLESLGGKIKVESHTSGIEFIISFPKIYLFEKD